MRYRPAICVMCWDYRPQMDTAFFSETKIWGQAQYDEYKNEVERRFFS